MPFHVFVNPSSGPDDDAPEIIAGCERELDDMAATVIRPELDLGDLIRRAVADGRTIVASGGDGTISAVAQHVVGSEGTLGVLPGGTLNHFARDLGVADMEVAFETLRSGEPRLIDVGRIDDRYFLNNVGLGLYPETVRERERKEDHLGKWLALATAALRMLAAAHRLRGTIAADDDVRQLLAWAVFIGNNRLVTEPGRLGERDELDAGVLEVRLFRAEPGPADHLKLAGKVLFERVWSSSRIVRTEAGRVEVRLKGRARPISRDGEVDPPAREIVVEMVPQGLRVLSPSGVLRAPVRETQDDARAHP